MANKARKKAEATINTADYDYKAIKIRDKSGALRTSTGNGDAVAKAMLLHKASGGSIGSIVRDNKLKMEQGKRNDGLFRMAVGVALRGLVRNGTPVKIGHVTVKTLKQSVALPKVEALAAPVRKASKPKARKSAKKAAPKAKRAPRAKKVDAPAPQQEAAAA